MSKDIENIKKLAIESSDSKNSNVAFLEKLEEEKHSHKLSYYIWLSRLYIFVACASLIVFMSASLSLFKLAPNVFVEPLIIINNDETKDIVRAEAVIRDMPSKDHIFEMFMKQYIVIRNSFVPDEMEMTTRWSRGGMVHYYSTNQIFDEFEPTVVPYIQSDVSANISRTVVIDSIKRIGGKKSPIWKADFRTFELNPNKTDTKAGAMKLTTRYWTASITASFYPERIFLGRRLINPLGFTVTDYSQAQVNVF